MENGKELKPYVRTVSNFGYAISDLTGVAYGILIGVLISGMINSPVISALIGFVCAAVIAVIGILIVWWIGKLFNRDGGTINLGLHAVMCLLAVGLWDYFWIGHTTDYLNDTLDESRKSPVIQILLCMFVPFYSIYWYYSEAARLDEISRSEGLALSDIAVICLILSIFLPIVAKILMQHRINQIESLCKVKANI